MYLAQIIGEKKAREFWFMGQQYSAKEAEAMGLVNKVVPRGGVGGRDGAMVQGNAKEKPDRPEELKASFNAATDWVYGLQAVAHGANSLFYGTEEALEGSNAFLEKRPPDFSPYRHMPW